LSQRTLNLGILAHVDAGKTSLTERLLFEHGAVAELGSVDAGNTLTDSGELERERGITIRSAVASFTLGDLRVNLIDTPGHPDFIAEVERALAVLDGAVLVLSAVEGVQAQTRVLMRSLRSLNLPTLLFVNKIDRAGARPGAVLADARAKLGLDVVEMNAPGAPFDELRELIVEQTAAGLLHPAYVGSALTGAGTGDLADGIATLLRPRPVPGAETTGLIFAIDRGPGGERVCHLRLFSGELRERQRVTFRRAAADGATTEIRGRVTGLDGDRLAAGDIGRLRGLPGVRVGDRLGPADDTAQPHFSPPGLAALVRPRHPDRAAALHAALTTLADEDPFIRTRAVGGGETSVLLYGAVQRQVIAARLERDFGVEAVFGEIQPVYVERLTGAGHALVEFNPHGGNDFWATIGLRVEPGKRGSGIRYLRDVEWGALPRAFHKATEEAVRTTLEQGLYGWEVIDCTVTVTRIGYQSPTSVAADFRGLAPVVLLRALRDAGTRVHEPCQAFDAEVPAEALSPVLGKLAALGAEITGSTERGTSWTVSGELPSRLVQQFRGALPGVSHGEGALFTRPGSDRPVRGPAPSRPRLDGNPLDREGYLRWLSNRNLS
jgi:ribosomal protection tetracycline resistance protein